MIEGRKETEIGIIPSEWNCPSIREISIRCKAGGTPRKNQKELWENGNIPFVLIEDMTSVLMYLKETKNFINQKGLESCSAWLVPKDTVLLSMYATVGKAVINKIPVATNQAILAIVTKPEVCKEFLAFALDNDSQRLLSYNVQSTQKNVNKGIVEQFKIPLPPFPEQRKIAHVLNTVQKAIEQQDKLIRTTTELKKTLMQKLFTEGTRGEPQKETEIGLVPVSWEVVELGDVCERVSINVEPNKDGNTPYVGLEHIIPGRLQLYNWGYENEIVSSKSKFKKDEILYGKLRPYLDKAVIAPFDGICSTDILVFTGKKEIENEYLIHFFHTEKLVGYANSTTTGVQHPRTSWNSLKRLKISLPDKDEQTEIAKSLNTLEDQIEILDNKKQTLTDLFKTLLHELMTGQRRVHELEFDEINIKVHQNKSIYVIAK